MNAAQRTAMDWALDAHAELDAEDAAPDLLGDGWFPPDAPPQQFRLTAWDQYSAWLLWSLKSGSFVTIFAGGALCGMYLAVWQMVTT